MAQMPEVIGLIPHIAAITRILNAVYLCVLCGQRMEPFIEALRHLPMLVQDEGRVDQLELGRGRDFHQTTSNTILPIAV